MTETEDPEEFNDADVGLEMLVVDLDGLVLQVIVAGYFSEEGRLEFGVFPVVLNQPELVQSNCG